MNELRNFNDRFNSIANYTSGKLLDTNFMTHSKLWKKFGWIIRPFLCLFGYHFPDIEAGKVAKKVCEFVSNNSEALKCRRNGDLRKLQNGIVHVAAMCREDQEAVESIEAVYEKINTICDDKPSERLKVELNKSLNELPTVTESFNPAKLEFPKEDYDSDRNDIYYKMGKECSYKFVDKNKVVLDKTKAIEKNGKTLAWYIKAYFERVKDKKTGQSERFVKTDPLLRAITYYLGSNGTLDILPADPSSFEDGFVPLTKNINNPTPVEFSFIVDPKNKDKATIVVKKQSGFFRLQDKLQFDFDVTITIEITVKGQNEVEVTTKRQFKPLD